MSKRAGGKSILATFGAFSERRDVGSSESKDTEKPERPPTTKLQTRVGAGVIGATQRSLSDLVEQRDRLQALVDAGGSTKFSPSLIDPSPFADRLGDDSDEEFEEFKRSVEKNGQKVPIQIRRHPSAEGRYQVVYGHRRLRAAQELRRDVKAVVVDFDDVELAIAQGIENGQRQDLSWIEKALFAVTMDHAGVKARDIRAALSIDDAELAKMRSVCRTVPRDMVEAIGRAPSVGRPRWLELAAAFKDRTDATVRLRKILSDDKVLRLRSDGRFRAALAALKNSEPPAMNPLKLETPGGDVLGQAAFSKGSVKISLSKRYAEEFGSFLEQELPELVEKFLARSKGN